MGRSRKTLGGGRWGDAMLETILNAQSQHVRHNGGGKFSKQRKWDKNATPLSRPSSTSPSPYHARNKGLKFKKNGLNMNGNNGGIHGDGKGEPLYSPRTANQALYLKYLMDDRVKIVLGVGPAGCGKTLFACHRAVEELMEGGIQKIVITRPMVSVEEESVGFLPGDMTQKMAPWTRPIFDIFHEYFDPLDVQDMIRRGVVEISPLAYMRGRTFKDAFIIADEMQNSTPNQMLMLTTRLGENAKMAITGDLKQSDKGLENNGLMDFMRKLYGYRRAKMAQESANEQGVTGGFLGVKLVQLCSSDVCRSEIVSRVLDMYQLSIDYSEATPGAAMDELMDTEEVEEEKGETYPNNWKKKEGKYKELNKVSVYQPKPKRYQTSRFDELEYQEDFDKNLKKIIEQSLVEQNSLVMEKELVSEDSIVVIDTEPVTESVTEPVTESVTAPVTEPVIESVTAPVTEPVTESVTEPVIEPVIEPVTKTVTEQEPEQEPEQWNGSSDSALIPKRDQERSHYFRFFS